MLYPDACAVLVSFGHFHIVLLKIDFRYPFMLM
jgi:hypothetical protein